MKITALTALLFLLLVQPAQTQNIYRTACQGNQERLDSLLQNTNINTQDNRGRSLLHWAVACGKPAIFEHLVARGIQPDVRDEDGATPLYMAVRFQQEALYDRLVGLLETATWKSRDAGMLYEKAVLNNNLDFVQKLQESGLPVNATNKRGSTPLEIALRLQNDSIANWLKAHGANTQLVRQITAKGPYMGQRPPTDARKVFAPNFISTEEYEFGSVFNKAGDEFYYGVDTGHGNEIRFSQLVQGAWTAPKTILAHPKYGYNDPFLSPDEQRLYFISNQAMDGQGAAKDIDIWYVERQDDGWSVPINAGPMINSDKEEYYISFTNSGTLFFSTDKGQSHHDIYYSEFVNGTYQQPVKLSEAINTEHYEADVFVDPNEAYLIFCAQRPEGMGRGDLYISFKQEDGSWSPSVNMGAAINTQGHELCPFVTHDGKYLLYTSNQDIYWAPTSLFLELAPRKR